jgi:hypothetical protein
MGKMNRRHFAQTILATCSFVLPAGCGFLRARKARYVLNVRLESDLSQAAASSVIQIQWIPQVMAGFDGVPLVQTRIWGEAPFADMAGIGTVFALLDPPQLLQGFTAKQITPIMAKVLPRQLRTNEAAKSGDMVEALLAREEFILGQADLPRLLRFREPSQRATAELIDGGEAAAMEPVVTVTQASLRRTEEPVSHRITSKELPTFDGKDLPPLEMRTSGPPTAWPMAARLYRTCFLFDGESE